MKRYLHAAMLAVLLTGIMPLAGADMITDTERGATTISPDGIEELLTGDAWIGDYLEKPTSPGSPASDEAESCSEVDYWSVIYHGDGSELATVEVVLGINIRNEDSYASRQAVIVAEWVHQNADCTASSYRPRVIYAFPWERPRAEQTDPSRQLVAATWDMGDGTRIPAILAATTDRVIANGVRHVYTQPGTYEITVEFEWSDGSITSDLVKRVHVREVPTVYPEDAIPPDPDGSIRTWQSPRYPSTVRESRTPVTVTGEQKVTSSFGPECVRGHFYGDPVGFVCLEEQLIYTSRLDWDMSLYDTHGNVLGSAGDSIHLAPADAGSRQILSYPGGILHPYPGTAAVGVQAFETRTRRYRVDSGYYHRAMKTEQRTYCETDESGVLQCTTEDVQVRDPANDRWISSWSCADLLTSTCREEPCAAQPFIEHTGGHYYEVTGAGSALRR